MQRYGVVGLLHIPSTTQNNSTSINEIPIITRLYDLLRNESERPYLYDRTLGYLPILSNKMKRAGLQAAWQRERRREWAREGMRRLRGK